jgi:hypothetical protein
VTCDALSDLEHLYTATGITVFILDFLQLPPSGIIPALGITNVTLSVATTILCTLIISAKIMLNSKMLLESTSGRNSDANFIVKIIVESAALYSISSLAYIPLITLSSVEASTYALYVDLFFGNMAVSGVVDANRKVLYGAG